MYCDNSEEKKRTLTTIIININNKAKIIMHDSNDPIKIQLTLIYKYIRIKF